MLSILDILRLVGYTTGTGLHYFLVRLLVRRRPRTSTEWTVLLLAVSTGLWHLGNMMAVLYRILGIGGFTGLLRTVEAVAFVGLGFLPSTLLHCHVSYFRSARGRQESDRSWLTLLIYLPVLLLPLAVVELLTGPYQPALQKLSGLILPFSIWFTAALWLAALLAFNLSGLSREQRERHLFLILAEVWTVIGVAMLVTFGLGARRWPVIGPYLETLVGLSSLLPAALLAYYIYRYHYLEIIIRRSFFYAISGALLAVTYLFGIRRLDLYVQEQFNLTPGAVELLMILALMFIAGPIAQWIDRTIEQLFVSEIGVYRQVAEQISREAARFGSVPELIQYTEAAVCRALELQSIRIILMDASDSSQPVETPVNDLVERFRQSRARLLDDHPSLEPLGGSCAVPLWHEDRLVGIMVVKATPIELTSSKRAALPVLAAQIAVALKNCQLIEEKLKLEQQLAERERLALLGQVAATIAHEVKNPLSSIKTIAQVMIEDDRLRSDYQRDLSLIISEIDRLNRTVSQLLSFSRPSAAVGEKNSLQQLIQRTVDLLSPEAEKTGVRLAAEVDGEILLPGSLSAAATEILSNLILNAIQATPSGGRVFVSGRVAQQEERNILQLAVTDEGDGIPSEMRERIFEPFFTTKQRGTGLGLTIIKRRLSEIGGSIEIESPAANERGTRIVITAPIRPSQ